MWSGGLGGYSIAGGSEAEVPSGVAESRKGFGGRSPPEAENVL